MTLHYFECKICGFDSKEAKRLAPYDTGICPLCFEDCGHIHEMRFRPATKVEEREIGGIIAHA